MSAKDRLLWTSRVIYSLRLLLRCSVNMVFNWAGVWTAWRIYILYWLFPQKSISKLKLHNGMTVIIIRMLSNWINWVKTFDKWALTFQSNILPSSNYPIIQAVCAPTYRPQPSRHWIFISV